MLNTNTKVNETIFKRKNRNVLFQPLILLLGVSLDPQEPERGQSTRGSITLPTLRFPDTGVDW